MSKQAISRAEEAFILKGIEDDIRQDGRNRFDYRDFSIETGILPHANGSALLNLGGSSRVLVGVKLEIGSPLPSKPASGQVFCSVDWSQPEPAGSDERIAYELLSASISRRLESAFRPSNGNNGGIDLEKLCIIPGKSCWIVYIDALVLGDGGNLVDAISLCARAALRNAKVPKVTLTAGEIDGETDFEISDDPMDYDRIDTLHIPICVSLTKLGKYYIIDPSSYEEACMTMQLTVAVDKLGNFCSMSKSGKGAIDTLGMVEMLQSVKKIGQSLLQRIDAVLEEEETKQIQAVGFQGL